LTLEIKYYYNSILFRSTLGDFMGNYIMQVDFFGNNVRCETTGKMVCLNDLLKAGNAWRTKNGLASKKLSDILYTNGFKDFSSAVARRRGVPVESLMQVVKGRSGRTMAHLYLAIYVAEQMSPEFHVEVIGTFIEGKLLEFRELGGTEFKNLNAAIDLYLPDREGKDNRGVYIQIAKLIRTKLMGKDAEAGCWDAASVAQIHSRYETENFLISALRSGLIRDYEHLKELIARI
jgi:hypothetical protein